jgi:hypothetical protein
MKREGTTKSYLQGILLHARIVILHLALPLRQAISTQILIELCAILKFRLENIKTFITCMFLIKYSLGMVFSVCKVNFQ